MRCTPLAGCEAGAAAGAGFGAAAGAALLASWALGASLAGLGFAPEASAAVKSLNAPMLSCSHKDRPLTQNGSMPFPKQ